MVYVVFVPIMCPLLLTYQKKQSASFKWKNMSQYATSVLSLSFSNNPREFVLWWEFHRAQWWWAGRRERVEGWTRAEEMERERGVQVSPRLGDEKGWLTPESQARQNCTSACYKGHLSESSFRALQAKAWYLRVPDGERWWNESALTRHAQQTFGSHALWAWP